MKTKEAPIARNKYPEETVDKIVEAATRLFTEKGYENTSIQDIIDNLGGLTKGAIYHHFKAKEDIMLAVLDRQYQELDTVWLATVRDQSGKTGLQKLKELFRVSMNSARQAEVFKSAPNMLKNSKMLTLQMEGIMAELAPQFVGPIIEEGVADGTIKTDYPRQLAEVILLLINLWVTPMVFHAPKEEMLKRLELFDQILKCFGADFLDDELRGNFVKLYDLYAKNAKPRFIQ